MTLYQRRINDVYVLLNELYKNEQDYTTKLYLINEKFFSLISSLSNIYFKQQKPYSTSSLQLLFQFLQNKYIYQLEQVSHFKDEILIPMSTILNDKSNDELFKNIKNYEKELENIKAKTLMSKERYIEIMKKAEETIYDYEMALKTLNGYEGFKIKKNQKISEAKAIEIEYRNNIMLYNQELSKFEKIEQKEKEIEINYVSFEKEKLKKLISLFQTTKINENNNFEETILKSYNEDNQIFDTETNRNMEDIKGRFTQITFEEYVPSILSSRKLVHDEIVYKTLYELKEKFNLEYGKKYDLVNAKKDIQFKKIIQHIMDHCETVNRNDLNTMLNLINEKKYRSKLIMHLNTERSKGSLFNSPISFNIITQIFEHIFSTFEINNENDFEDIKNTLLLSQSFYKNENGNKIFIEEKLKNNKLLSNIEFWKFFIDIDINKEFTSNKSTDEKAIKQIPFFKIAIQLTNLVEFSSNVNQVYELVNFFDQKYKMNFDEIIKLKKEIGTIEKKKLDKKNLKNQNYICKSYNQTALMFKGDFALLVNSDINIDESYIVNS